MASRCIWSGEVSEKIKTLDTKIEHKGQTLELSVLPEYQAKAERFLSYYQKYRILFQRLMAVGIMLVVLATFSADKRIESLGWIILGITFLLFPFGHRPDFQGLSLRRSIIIARVLSVAFFGMAVFIYLR